MSVEYCPVSGKVSIASKRAADRAAREQRNRGRRGAQAYRCEHPGCDAWHVASQWVDVAKLKRRG